MSVKIFLPSELFYTKSDSEIYGEIHISDNNCVSYFVISAITISQADQKCNLNCADKLRHLGCIERGGSQKEHVRNRDISLGFCYDPDTPNIYLAKLSIKPSKVTGATVFLYNPKTLLQLHCEPTQEGRGRGQHKDEDNIGTNEHHDDIRMLFNLIVRCRSILFSSKSQHSLIKSAIETVSFPMKAVNKIFILLIECKPIYCIVKRTVFYEHYLDWQKFKESGIRNYNIALDKMLGVFVMIILLFYIPHPGDYLTQATHFVISNVRLILHSLKGSPIGLKLNVHLNNFLLDCFSHHIDLWASFLSLIDPAVRELFVPIALLGFLGLSFQLALLSDLVSVIGLHAYCFYIYTAVLYKVEIKGLQVLWKVVLGKRRNLLNNRVESHNYMNRQLYLATIFFTSLLFLFPTILVYYAVFTTLRLCLFLINLILKVKRRRILEFPLKILLKWLSGNFFEIESLQLEHLEHASSPLLQPESKGMRMCVFVINVKSSSLRRVFSCESEILKEFLLYEKGQISLSSIIKRILHGEF